jgi:lipopolysaccharide/colanic/teichoic acid biosynthesis glycosyltransferase
MTTSASSAQEAAVAKPGGSVPRTATRRAVRLSASATPTARYLYTKRALDVLLASVFIVVAFPLLVVFGLLTALDSGWPVFYRQERVSARARRHGGRWEWVEQRFRIVKFRTMVRGADSAPVHEQFIRSFVRGDVEPDGVDDGRFKLHDDPRITRVGRVLRATSLDELPQLFNVIGGTMSLVGPRPVPLYEVALYEPRHLERLAAKPGLTGAWQVHGRGRVSFEEMVRLDVEYVRRQSLWLDLVLLARTLPAVCQKKGAR